jgi:hypothetical protein
LEEAMNPKIHGFVDGHPVEWEVRHVTWCHVCGTRESAGRDGLCVRCAADARLLVDSVFGVPAEH